MRTKWILACAPSAVVLMLVGCSKKAEPPKGEETPKTPPAAATATPSGPTVELTGTIRFEGTPPERKVIRMSADDNCTKQHTQPVLTDDIVVGTNGGLQNVFVSVKSGLEGKTFAAPTTPAQLDQKGCVYIPHVFGFMANQPLRILNSDPTLHNVHGMPTAGDEFNTGMPRQGMEITRTFKEPGRIRFKCDVHPWMQAFAQVMTHPFYGVSDEVGRFTISNLPPGEYTIEAWHEKLGTKTATITVGAQGATTATLDFTFTPSGS